MVTEYLQRYPKVNANCWFLDRVVNMLDDGVDVGVRIGELPDSSMQAIRVGQVRWVICAAPSYLQAHGTPSHPDDLSQHAVVLASAVSPAPQWRLVENGEPCIVHLQPRMATTTNDSAVAAAVAGFGVTQLMSYQVADHLRAGRLQVLLAEFEPAPLPVSVLHREGRHASRKARAFIDLAVERLRANPAPN